MTSESTSKIAQETTFEKMKANPTTNYKHWDTYGLRNTKESEFMRKGQVGDYKNHFDEEVEKNVDVWIDVNLQKYPNLKKL